MNMEQMQQFKKALQDIEALKLRITDLENKPNTGRKRNVNRQPDSRNSIS